MTDLFVLASVAGIIALILLLVFIYASCKEPLPPKRRENDHPWRKGWEE
jgi:hypothetical protein